MRLRGLIALLSNSPCSSSTDVLMTGRRSPAIRLARRQQISSGSIRTVVSGKYTVVERAAASRSIGPPRVTKSATIAIWIPTRSWPSAVTSQLSASSTSSVSSSSIVNATGPSIGSRSTGTTATASASRRFAELGHQGADRRKPRGNRRCAQPLETSNATSTGSTSGAACESITVSSWLRVEGF